jgi:hypothetical protein
MMNRTLRNWTGRFLIGLVLLINVQCALSFLISPELYAPNFEMSGAVGTAMVRGMGILFLMWNVPYGVAAFDPLRKRTSLMEAIIMQAIGFAGESLLLATFPSGHMVIREAISRFLIFDGSGLLALLLAAWITVYQINDKS